MTHAHHARLRAFRSALKAIAALWEAGYTKLDTLSNREGFTAHLEIRELHFGQKTAAFFRYLLPLRKQMVALLAETYRRYFKLALAHTKQTGGDDPDKWARSQLQPGVGVALEWIRDWYILACDGENQRIWRTASVDFVPGQTVSLSMPSTVPPVSALTSWRAPAWLFVISAPSVGIGPLKQRHVPNMESPEKLGEAHTRLLLKGAKRVFLWELDIAIENVRNEEIAAAGAILTDLLGEQLKKEDKRKGAKPHPVGMEKLGPKKTDLSRYMVNLTDKQEMAFSLKYEYQLGSSEIASRMKVDRKTASEHIEAAKRKIDQARSGEKRKAQRSNNVDD